MLNKIKFSDKAKNDLRESVKFYEDRQIGLGKIFLNTIQEKTIQIQSRPEINPPSQDEIRKAKVKTFPFYIYYIFRSQVILIIAIWHVARLPFSNKDRIETVK